MGVGELVVLANIVFTTAPRPAVKVVVRCLTTIAADVSHTSVGYC